MATKTTYNPSKAERGRVKRTVDTYIEMKSQKRQYETDADEAEKRYRMDVTDREADIEEWQANISSGYIFSIVQSQLAMLANKNVGFELFPETRKAELVQPIYEDVLENAIYQNNLRLRTADQILETLVYGTGPAQAYYKHEKRTVKQELFANTVEEYTALFKKKNWEEKEITVKKGCHYEPFSFYDWFTWANSVYLEDANEVIRRYVLSFEDYKRIYKDYPNFKHVKPGGDTQFPELYKRVTKLDDSQVEILWHWNVAEDFLTIVANGIVELAYMPVPYKGDNGEKLLPFTVMNNSIIPRVHYGRPEPIILRDLEDELNALHNMMLDKTMLDINRPIFAEEEFDGDEFYNLAPRSIIQVTDANAFKEMNTKSDFAEARFLMQTIEENLRRTSGINENALSNMTNGTATEAAILKESLEDRMKYKITRMENQGMSRLGRIWVSVIRQFYGMPEMVEITGEDEMTEYVSLVAERFPGAIDYENNTIQKYPVVTAKDKENQPFNYVLRPEFLSGAKFRVEGKTESTENRLLEADRFMKNMNLMMAPPFQDRFDWDIAAEEIRKMGKLPRDIVKVKDRNKQNQIRMAHENAQKIESGIRVPVPPNVSQEYVVLLQQYFNSKEFDEQVIQMAMQHIAQAEAQLQGMQGGEPGAGGPPAYPSAPGLNGQALQPAPNVRQQDVMSNFGGSVS